MRATPNQFEQAILNFNQSLAPADGNAFHEADDLELFRHTRREEYLPNNEVVVRICGLFAVGILSGAFGVGKNGAKQEAVAMSAYPRPWDNVPQIHPVINKTTRLPEFRDGRVEEDGVDYFFAYRYAENRAVAQALREKRIVQFAQPRGDHVYFTDLECFPIDGIALMDAVPDTVRDMNRILAMGDKQAIAMHRTVDTFEEWMVRIAGRGDIFDHRGEVIDPENYRKRMQEGANSLTMAMDTREELDTRFFAAEERPEAGKAVIDILMDRHPEAMQQRALKGAYLMLQGLAELGFVPQ